MYVCIDEKTLDLSSRLDRLKEAAHACLTLIDEKACRSAVSAYLRVLPIMSQSANEFTHAVVAARLQIT
jgi:hypothetical protein